MKHADSELLHEFVRNGSQNAFAELVRRHVDLVYSAALRQVVFQAQAAEDVTQTVFVDFARKAESLLGRKSLTGWLYHSTRLAAAESRRSEARRLARESAAHAMSQLLTDSEPGPEWERIRPLLDDAMGDLNASDREAVLLRFFEKRPLAEIGAQLALSENTARMRIDRALDKLHGALAKRGITSTAAALGLVLGAHAVGVAPPGLAGRIPRAIPVPRTGAIVFRTAAGKSVLALVVTGLAIVGLLVVRTGSSTSKLGSGPGMGLPTVMSSNPASGFNGRLAESTVRDFEADSPILGPDDRILRLEFLDQISGEPVPEVRVDYSAMRPKGSEPANFTVTANNLGEVKVPVPADVERLVLTSRLEGYADTQLEWNPPQGVVPPTNYVARLALGAPISGRVVDPDGKPVAGAKVGFRLDRRDIQKSPVESHQVGYISVTTDDLGRWNTARIGADVLRSVSGIADHPAYQPSIYHPLGTSQENPPQGSVGDSEGPLRSGAFVFQLQRGITVHGAVVDGTGSRVAGARVVVGCEYRSTHSKDRVTRTDSDGSFEVQGCVSSNVLVTVFATGFAPRAVRVAEPLRADEPIQVVLQPPSILRFRVQTPELSPIGGAKFLLDPGDNDPVPDQRFPPKLKMEFRGQTDAEGRAEWTEAPSGKHTFLIGAPGFQEAHMILKADGNEQLVILDREMIPQTLTGTIIDAKTRKAIPLATLSIGTAYDPGEHYGLFTDQDERLLVGGGRFRHELRASNVGRSYIFKFEADGYAPYFSPVLQGGKGEFRLEVVMEPAVAFEVRVLRPDGRPAGKAEIGLVRPGHQFLLTATGISRLQRYTASDVFAADADGRVNLATDATVEKVIAVHKDGYSTRTLADLAQERTFQLQPWSRLEGEIPRLGAGGTNQIWITPAKGPSAFPVRLDIDRVSPTSEGRFCFAHLPAGDWQVSSTTPRQNPDGSTTFVPGGDTMVVTLAAGETARIRFAGGARVRGRIQFPAGISIPDNTLWEAHAHTPIPIPPSEVFHDETALTKWREQPEIKAAMMSARSVKGYLDRSGNVVLEAVQPGRYSLNVLVVEDPSTLAGQPSATLRSALKCYVRGTIEFSVPDPTDGSELDLGVIQTSSPTEEK